MDAEELRAERVRYVDLSELSAAPAVGRLVFLTAGMGEGGDLQFHLDCDRCPDSVKIIPITAGMTVVELGNVALGHREVHDELEMPPQTYAQELLPPRTAPDDVIAERVRVL